jgi:hypothetical protein
VDSHTKTGADEDVALAAATRVMMQAIEADAPDADLRRALSDEKKAGEEIIDLYTRHLAEQMSKARELDRAVQKSAAPKLNSVLKGLGDDNVSALL